MPLVNLGLKNRFKSSNFKFPYDWKAIENGHLVQGNFMLPVSKRKGASGSRRLSQGETDIDMGGTSSPRRDRSRSGQR